MEAKMTMVDQLQPDIRKLITLVRQAEKYDATVAAAQLTGKPVELSAGATDEIRRKGQSVAQLCTK